jgi:ABC-2 type transport system ATP-binding protein
MTMDQPAIKVQALSKKFGRRSVVNGLTFQVPSGTVCGFLGRNGAGKSTTIRVLMDLLRPTSGTAYLLGMNCQKDHHVLMERVGYVAESPTLCAWMKVRQLIDFTAAFYSRWNRNVVESLLGRFGIDLDQRIKHLSRGTYAQVALALALGNDPQLLVLDEPAMGLDVMVRRDFLESIIQLIQQDGRTVLFSSHLVHEVERIADQIVILEKGRLLVSAPTEVLKQEIRRMIVRRRNIPQDRFAVPGILSSCSDGGELVLTVEHRGGQTRQAIEDVGGEVVEVVGMSLEEIFIDLLATDRKQEAA